MTSPIPGLPQGALSGVRVLDFTHVLAGPYCTMILADLGADVIKVENPQGGDLTRMIKDEREFSAYFGSINRGKRSIVIDVKKPAGLDLMLRMADKADVFVQNQGPGVAERLGLGHACLMERNPRLIYAMVTGYGLDGPWADRKGVDPAVQALSGAMSITGYPDAPPARVGFSSADLAGGLFLALGVLAALNERSRSGRGQYIDVSLLESQMALLENALVRHLDTGVVPQRVGGAHPLETLTRSYQTLDSAMVVGLSGRNWPAACRALGRDDWAEDASLLPPEAHLDVLLPQIERIMRTKSTADWMHTLAQAKVQCTPILNIEEAAKLPPIVERGFIRETVDGNGRRLRVAGSPLRLSRTPAAVRSAAPLLGEHTRGVLADWLGMPDEDFAALEQDGVFQHYKRQTRGFW